ncbi:MAG TPA: hypothetical protein VGC79_34220, partial [Polyangiaceae bacterium]
MPTTKPTSIREQATGRSESVASTCAPLLAKASPHPAKLAWMTEYLTAVKRSKAFPELVGLDSVRFLIPDPPIAWNATACGLPAEPANCVAEKASRSIICNPAMARLLTGASLGVGSSSQEHLLASRFLAYVIVGHELAHLAHPTQALALADALP